MGEKSMTGVSKGSQDLKSLVRREGGRREEEAEAAGPGQDQPKDPLLGGYSCLSALTPRLARARDSAVPPAALT